MDGRLGLSRENRKKGAENVTDMGKRSLSYIMPEQEGSGSTPFASKKPFDISVINNNWMMEAHKEMWDNAHMQELRRIEEKVKSKFQYLEKRRNTHQINIC